jgi:Tol biopolymer transport system component
MTDPTFDRQFTAWLEERAQPHAPTGLAADIVERTARSRPRPAWRVPERWFSMPTTIRLALIPRGLLLIFALWLILSLTIAGAAIGGRLEFTQAVLPPAPVTGPTANGLIAFERDGDIFVVEPDGTGERPFIASPGIESGPDWSPDGTRIAYQSSAAEGAPTDIVVANADGTSAVTVATGDLAEFAWSPDGTRIAYLTNDSEGAATDVVVANADGTGATTVATGDLDFATDDFGIHHWSPDGTALILSRTDATRVTPCSQVAWGGDYCGRRIFTAATDGSTGAVQVGDPELDVRGAIWSPDGTRISFAGFDGETIRLYVMDPDGTDVRPVSTSSGTGWSFWTHSWSPDGTQLVAQVEGASGNADIVLVAADGSGDTLVTETPIYESGPAFAVDGSIAWWADRFPKTDPCCTEVLGADGVQAAAPGQGQPSFSPDGRYFLTAPSDAELVALGVDEAVHVVDRDGTITATILTGGLSWQRLAL